MGVAAHPASKRRKAVRMMKYTLAERKRMRTWLFAVLFAAPLACFAQAYPARAVQVIVPFPAGSAPDIVARTLTERLSALWSQRGGQDGVAVENRPGAGGIPGMT